MPEPREDIKVYEGGRLIGSLRDTTLSLAIDLLGPWEYEYDKWGTWWSRHVPEGC